MATPDPVIVGIDPGSAKCGVALVTADGRCADQGVVPAADLLPTLRSWLSAQTVRAIVMGDGTGSRALYKAVEAEGQWLVVTRPEYGTTLEARARYWREHPPRGWWRLIPTTMRVPPEPFDDLVAILLAERLWREYEGAEP